MFGSLTFQCVFSTAIYLIQRCHKAFSLTTLFHEDNVRYGVRSCSRFLTRLSLVAFLYLYVFSSMVCCVRMVLVCIFVSLRSLMLADRNESRRWFMIGKRKRKCSKILILWNFRNGKIRYCKYFDLLIIDLSNLDAVIYTSYVWRKDFGLYDDTSIFWDNIKVKLFRYIDLFIIDIHLIFVLFLLREIIFSDTIKCVDCSKKHKDKIFPSHLLKSIKKESKRYMCEWATISRSKPNMKHEKTFIIIDI